MEHQMTDQITAQELATLLAEFREGIPNWMFSRDYNADKVRELMKLRRRAFPKTVPEE
jgi:hypothetical protein